jgi:hypothetical protein
MRRFSGYIFRLFMLAVCGVALSGALFITSPMPAHAATNPITATSHAQVMHFPNSVDISMTATDSSSTITSATLYISVQLGGIYGGSVGGEQHTVTVAPAKTASFSYSEDLTGSSFVRPGTPINYYWVIQDSANRSYTGTTQNFVIADSRFAWQHLTHGLMQVNWYNQPQSFGQAILNHAVSSLDRISHNLGVTPYSLVNLWIYADHADFTGAIGPYAPEWEGGEANPEFSNAFFVIADPNDTAVVRDMPHEMTHLVFAQLEVHALDVPQWFNEGLAVYNQEYHEPAMQQSFQQALDTQSLLRLDTIAGSFPQNSDQAYLAYAQSWNLVAYMYRTFGQAKMTAFLKAISSPLIGFNDAMKQTLGVDVAHLENQWRVSLNQPPISGITGSRSSGGGVSPTLSSTATTLTVVSFALFIAAILVVVLVLVTMRRRKRQIFSMDDEHRTTETTTRQDDAAPKV